MHALIHNNFKQGIYLNVAGIDAVGDYHSQCAYLCGVTTKRGCVMLGVCMSSFSLCECIEHAI